MSELSFDLVLSMLNSDEEFPINLEDAWQWLGYSRKDTAKNTLVSNFEQGVDYIIHLPSETGAVATLGFPAFTRQDVYLTVECFKAFGMLAGTAKGKEVRKYFLRCEKQLKELLKSQVVDKQKEQKTLAAEVRNKHRESYPARSSELIARGVRKASLGHFANADYKILRGAAGRKLRNMLGITKKDLIVDHLETHEQALLVFSHALQVERMKQENTQSYQPCIHVCVDTTEKLVAVRDSMLLKESVKSQSQLPSLGID